MKEIKEYSVCDPETLRQACIENEWFTEGTINQYNKLFYANDHGCTLGEIAVIIWVCSDVNAVTPCLLDIIGKLNHLRRAYRTEVGKMSVECCKNCGFYSELEHNFRCETGYVLSYCCTLFAKDNFVVEVTDPNDRCEYFTAKKETENG